MRDEIKDKLMAKPSETMTQHIESLNKALKEIITCGYIMDPHIIYLIQEAIAEHDDGKVIIPFQIRVTSKRKLKFDATKEVPHNVLSVYFINPEKYISDDYYIIVCAILEHHNYGNAIELMSEKKELIHELLNPYKDETYLVSSSRRLRGRINQIRNRKETTLVKGLLIKCDYAASGHYVAEYPNDFMNDCLDRLLLQWKQQSSNASWNSMQEFCMNHQEENIIVIAQTGMGKTEGGLLWLGNNKGFFVLPVRTAINAMYQRIREKILFNEKISTRLAILHSESLSQYDAIEDLTDITSEQYNLRGKHLSIPLSVTTMDQLFDFVFRYQGYEMKLATFGYSKFIIDEIQMYSPGLLAYLVYGIKAIINQGGKIAIVTATLAPFMEDLLKPVIFSRGTFINDCKRHNLKVYEDEMTSQKIIDFYCKKQQEHKSIKVLVICNTIKKAQSMYEELIETHSIPADYIHILHSRFIKMDREHLEQEILAFAGPDAKKQQVDGIWISTSVVEASLDIDFDYLFTELQDINSLFQRLGRCNRYGLKDVQETNCFVFTHIPEKYLRNSANKTGFIDETIYRLSIKALHQMRGIVSEQEKLDALNNYFTMQNVKDSEFMRSYREAYQELELLEPFTYQKEDIHLRDILSETVIPSPVYLKHRSEISKIEEVLTSIGITSSEVEACYQQLLPYTVSIPTYEYKYYQRCAQSGVAVLYPVIRCGKFRRLSVIECQYDKEGFKRLDFNTVTREANIW